jgi:acyl-CoA reductase-like NAD-dependent aldehyde dehydrogenase
VTADVMSINPRTGAQQGPVADETDPEQVAKLTQAAADAAAWLDGVGRAGRADLLVAMAAELEADAELITAVAERESALGVARLTGELARRCFQLRFFGEVLRDGGYLEVTIDHADADALAAMVWRAHDAHAGRGRVPAQRVGPLGNAAHSWSSGRVPTSG